MIENNNGVTPQSNTRLSVEEILGAKTSGPINPSTGLTEDSKSQERLTTKEIAEGFSGMGALSSLVSPGSTAKYEKVLGEGRYHPEFGYQYNQELLHEQQTVGDQFVNFLGQLAGEVIGGTVEGIGYIADLGAGFRLANDTQAEFGNEISNFGTAIKDWSREVAPIYMDPYKQDKFDPMSASWWFSNGVSIASTLSLLIPSGLATKGTMMIAEMLNVTSKLGKAGRVVASGVIQSLFSRHAENLMEASGVYKENYQKALAQGMSEPDAKKLASLAASNTYNKQWALLAQDLPQYILFNKLGALRAAKKAGGVLNSKTAAPIQKWFGKSQLATTAGKTGAIALDMVGEGGEELYQAIVNEQSNRMFDAAAHPGKDVRYAYKDILKDQYDSGDFWTQGFFGAIGAGVMQAGFAGMNYKALQNTIKTQMEDLKLYGTSLNQAFTELNAAINSKDLVKAETAFDNFLITNRIRSKVHGTDVYNEKMLSELEKGVDEQTAQRWGLSAEAANGLKNDPELVAQIRKSNERIDNLYSEFQKENAKNDKIKGAQEKEASAQVMTHTQFLKERAEDRLKKAQTKRGVLDSQLEDFQKISPTGREKYNQEAKIAGFEKVLSHLQNEKNTQFQNMEEIDQVKLDESIATYELLIDQSKKGLEEIIKNHKAEKVIGVDGVERPAEEHDKQYVIPSDKITERNAEIDNELVNTYLIDLYNSRMDAMRAGKTPSQIKDEEEKKGKDEKETFGDGKYGDLTTGDIVEFIDKNNNPAMGTITSVTPGKPVADKTGDKIEDSYIVHPIDPISGEPLGTEETYDSLIEIKSAADLHLIAEENDFTNANALPEILEDSEIKQLVGTVSGIEDVTGQYKDEMQDIENISYSDWNVDLKKPIPRNEKLAAFLKRKRKVAPSEDKGFLKSANVYYFIDTSTPEEIARVQKFAGTLTEEQKPLFIKFISGEHLMSEEIKVLTTAISSDEYSDFVDQVPISIKIRYGGEDYQGNLFLHSSNFKYVKLPKSIYKIKNKARCLSAIELFQKDAFAATRRNRKLLVEQLLTSLTDNKGKVVYTNKKVNRRVLVSQGLSLSRGYPNSGDTNRKLTEVLGVPSSKIRIAFAVSSESNPYTSDLSDSAEGVISGTEMEFTSSGNAYMWVDGKDTLNGKPIAVKLNVPFISEEHAGILWDAFTMVGRYGKQRSPYALQFAGTHVIKDESGKERNYYPLVQGLRVGHTIDLLVKHGMSTDPNSTRFKKMYPDPVHATLMRDRTLYINPQNGVLHWGFNSETGQSFDHDMTQTNESYNREAKAQFVKWISTHKRYATYRKNKALKLTLNGDFLVSKTGEGRAFRIGVEHVIERKRQTPEGPLPTYKEFLIDNGLLLTNLEADPDGALFRDPVIASKITTHAGGIDTTKLQVVSTSGKYKTVAQLQATEDDTKTTKKTTQAPITVVSEEPKLPEVPVAEPGLKQPNVSEQAALAHFEEADEAEGGKIKEKELPYKNSFENESDRTVLKNGTVLKGTGLRHLIKNVSDEIETLFSIGTKVEEIIDKITTGLKEKHIFFTNDFNNLHNFIRFRANLDTENTLEKEFYEGLTKGKPETSVSIDKVPTDETPIVAPPSTPGRVKIDIIADPVAAAEGLGIDPTDMGTFLSDVLGDDIDEDPHAKPYKGGEYEVADIYKDMQWAFDIIGIGKEEWDIKKRWVDMLLDGRLNFGLYSQSAIKLFELAEVGTVYHESFHRVSLGYFTNRERSQMYRAARQIYKLDPKDYSDSKVEEFLAAKFEEYVLNKGTRKMPGAIQRFFQPLFDFLRRVFVSRLIGETEIDRIFNQISRGDYRTRKVLEENRELVKPGEYRKTFIGEFNFNHLDTRYEVTDLIKGLASELFKKNNISNIDDIKYLEHRPLVMWLHGRRVALHNVAINPNETAGRRAIAGRLRDLYDEVLGEQDLSTGLYQNYKNIIKPQIDLFLNSIGVQQKGNNDVGGEYYDYEESDTGVDINSISVTGSVSRLGTNYNKEAYEFNKKDTARASIKFMVATLRTASEFSSETNSVKYLVNKKTGFHTFVDFNDVWSRLYNSLYWINNIEDMIAEMKAIAEQKNYAPFAELAYKLENSTPNTQRQFLVTLRSSKSDYITFSAKRNKRTGVYEITKNKTADKEAAFSTIGRWNNDFFSDRNIITEKYLDNNQYNLYFNLGFFKKIADNYGELKIKVKNNLDEYRRRTVESAVEYEVKQFDTIIADILELLYEFNITPDYDSIRHLIKLQKGADVSTDLEKAYSFISNDLKQLFANTDNTTGNDAINYTDTAYKELPIDRKKVSLFKNAIVEKIANAYITVHPELISDMHVGPQKSNYYSFNDACHIVDVQKNIQHKNGYVEEQLSAIGNSRSRWLRDLTPKRDAKGNVSQDELDRVERAKAVVAFEEFSYFSEANANDAGRGYLDLTPIEDYLAKFTAVMSKDMENPENNLLPLPSMPRKGYRFIKGVRGFGRVMTGYVDGKILFSKDVLDYFYDAYIDELEKVNASIETRDLYLAATGEEKERIKRTLLVQNEHYAGNASNVDISGGNGYALIKFSELNTNNKKEKQEPLQKVDFDIKMSEVLNQRVQDEVDFAQRLGVIGQNKEGKYFPGMIDDDFISSYETEYKDGIHIGTIGVIADYTMNTMLAVIESEKVFFADPSFFGKSKVNDEVWDDLYKRWFGVTASGSSYAETTEEDTSTMYSVLPLNTQTMKATFYDDLVKIHQNLWIKYYTKNNKTKLSEDEIKEKALKIAKMRAHEYESMDPTDGQAWISPTMYKKLMMRSGLWEKDSAIAKAFDLMMSNKTLDPKEELELLALVMNPLKTVYVGTHIKNGQKELVYDKMSMAVLFPRLVKGTHLETLYDRMELTGVYADRQIGANTISLTKIDVANFESATKSGGTIGYDLYKDKNTRTEVNNLFDVVLQERYWTNLRNQLVTDSKEEFDEQAMGTAFYKIASSNIDKLAKYGEFKTGLDLLNALTSSRVSISNLGRHEVDAMLGINNGRISREDLMRMLRSDSLKAKKSDDFRRALKVDPKTGIEYLQLDAFPDRRWIYSKLLNLITKKTIDLVTPGAQLYQASSYGLRKRVVDDSLKFGLLNESTGIVARMECRVSIRLFKKLIPNYSNLSHEERVAAIKHLGRIPLLGYRTPTQGQNSTVSLEAVEYLPDSAGDTIYLPLEFVALTGSDFDIDKLFVMFRNYEFDETGKAKEIKFDTDVSEEAINRRYINKVEELYRIYKKDKKVFSRTTMDIIKGIKNPMSDDEFTDTIEMLDATTTTELFNAREAYNNLKTLYDTVTSTEEKDNLYSQMLDQQAIIDAIIDGQNFDKKETFDKRAFEIKKKILTERGKIGTIEEFSKLSLEEQNSSKANKNRIVDIFDTVLRDEKHYLTSSQPLGAVKGQVVALANRVEKLENGGKIKKTEMLESYTPKYQSEFKTKYQLSTEGVGVFALANAHHSLTQHAGIKMLTGIRYHNYQDGTVPLDSIIGYDDFYITDWLSAMIDAHVDALKDNYISKLNVNDATYGVTSLLLRLGYGLDTFKFMTQPAIKEYAEAYLALGGRLRPDEQLDIVGTTEERAYVKVFKKYKLAAGFDKNQEVQLFSADDQSLSFGKLVDFYKNQGNFDFDLNPENAKEEERNRRQLAVLIHFKRILEDANALNRLVLESRVDTKKLGATPSEQKFSLNKLREIEREGKFLGLSRLINSSGVLEENGTMLAPLLANSMLYLGEITKDLTLYATDGFDNLFWKVLNSIPGSVTIRKSTVNNIVEEMFSFFIGEFFGDPTNGIGFTRERLHEMLTVPDKSIFRLKALLSRPDHPAFEQMKKNKMFNLVQVDSRLDVPMDTFLRTTPTFLADVFATEDYIQDYYAMLHSDNADVLKFARMLWVYSFYSTGFRHRFRSPLKYTPTSQHKKTSIIGVKKDDHNKLAIRNDISLDNFIRTLIQEMNMSPEEMVDKYFAPLLDSLLTNNHANKWWVPVVNFRNTPIIQYATVEGIVNLIELNVAESPSFNLGRNSQGDIIYTNFVQIPEGAIYNPPSGKGKEDVISANNMASLYGTTVEENTDALYEFIGINEETGNPVYRARNRKGVNQRGVVLREFGLRDKGTWEVTKKSVINENNLTFELSDSEIQHVINANIPGFRAIPPEMRVIEERSDMRRTMDRTNDEARRLWQEDQDAKTVNKIRIMSEPLKVKKIVKLGSTTTTQEERNTWAELIQSKPEHMRVAYSTDRVSTMRKREKYLSGIWKEVATADATIYSSAEIDNLETGTNVGFWDTSRAATFLKKNSTFYVYIHPKLIEKGYVYDGPGRWFSNPERLRQMLLLDGVETLNIGASPTSSWQDLGRLDMLSDFNEMLKVALDEATPVSIAVKKDMFSESKKATSDPNSLSTASTPIVVYADGAVGGIPALLTEEETTAGKVQPVRQYGHGLRIRHPASEKTIQYSGNKEEINREFEALGIGEVVKQNQFSPSVELYSIISALKQFEETAEHLEIRTDYIGAISFKGLEEYAPDDPLKPDSESLWTPNKDGKSPHMPILINEIVRLINKIENNGGSVVLRYVPRYDNSAGWKVFEETYAANNWKNWTAAERTAWIWGDAKNGNKEVDLLAKNTSHIDTLTEFVNKIKTNRERVIKQGFNMTEKEQGEGKETKKSCE